MSKINYKMICNIICAVLMLALLVFQFMPGFWTCQKSTPNSDGTYLTESASLQQYMWTPSEFLYFEKYFEGQFGKDFELNDVILMPVMTLVFSVLGILFGMIKYNKSWGAIFSALVGGFGVFGYLGHPIFQMNPSWVIHLVLCILILAVSLASLVITSVKKIIALKKEFNVK